MKALLPDRHPTKDFFVCDLFEALPGINPGISDDRASMEHPIFSLSTKPDLRTLRYEHNGNIIEIIPSTRGLATIHDKDVLLYCISHLRNAIKKDEPVSQTIRLTAHDLLVTTNRNTDGRGYDQLTAALIRLRGTQIITDIETRGIRKKSGFGLIEHWDIITKHPIKDRMIAMEIKLSDWFFNAVLADELLSINHNYFRLRKPLERRLYEIGRKHCGEQPSFTIGLNKLKLKMGSNSLDKQFKYLIGKIVETDQTQKHFPDYGLHLNSNNTVTFFNRRYKQKKTPTCDGPTLATWAYEKAKKAAPGIDVYAIERDFKEWIKDKEKPEKGYEAAFIGFCKHKASQGRS